MQLDKDTLLKHRFWILLGVVMPMILIVLIVLMTSVGSATETEKKKVDSTLQSLNLPAPKNEKWLVGLNEKDKKLAEKRNEVWAAAWRAQAGVFTWPADRELEPLRNASFGDPIDRHVCSKYAGQRFNLQQAREIYKIVQPVNARGDGVVLVPRGPNVIVTVPKFAREEPPFEELWLAQEDLWVQRELLQVVRDANDSVAVFKVLPNFAAMGLVGPGVYKRVREQNWWPTAKKGEQRQRFYNPYWELDLTLARNAKNEPVLRGKITNVSRRKLPLGIRFHVKLREGDDAGVGNLDVDGESVAAGHSLDLKESSSLAQAAPEGLFGVEQEFTWKTAPVKRLDLMALFRQSHRTANVALKPARQFPSAAEPGKAPEDPAGGGDAPSTGRMAPGGPGGETSPVGGPLGGGPGAGQVRTTESGLIRDRYIHVTEQVRRMPVALTVTVEQAHIPNVIAAFSNSKLRMQVTQVHMVHVRGDSLRAPTEGAPGGPDDPFVPGKPGVSPLPAFPPGGTPDGGGDVLGPRGVRGGGIFGGGTPQPGTTVLGGAGEEDQGNLVELTVYALASLYERFRPGQAAAAPGSGDAEAGKPAPGKTGP